MEMFFRGFSINKCFFSFNLAIDLHYKSVKVYQLTRESIESNPSPRNYTIKKARLTSYHQGYVHYGDQQECNVETQRIFSIIYSAVKRIGLCKSLHLNIILAQGDYLNLSESINHFLRMNFPLYFNKSDNLKMIKQQKHKYYIKNQHKIQKKNRSSIRGKIQTL